MFESVSKNSWLVSVCALLKKICILQRTCVLLWACTSCDGLFDRRQRRVKVSVGALVCQCIATVSAQGTPPQTTDVSCVPQEAYVRSRWGREERALFERFTQWATRKPFIVLFFGYPVLASFLHELTLNCFTVYAPPWCRHTHTHICRQSRLLVPVLSSQVPVGLDFSNVQMINGLRNLKALSAAATVFSSIPPIPLVLLTPLPSLIPSMFECRSTHAHTERATKCWWGSSQPLRVVLCHSGSCCIVSGGVGEGTCSGWRDCCWLARLWLQRVSWQNVKLEDVSSSPQQYTQPKDMEKVQISHTHPHTLKGVVESWDGTIKVSADGQAG